VQGLPYSERAATGEAAGLLVLHHGRGADDRNILALADVLDPRRTLHVVAPRAPLILEGAPGYHWYVVGRVGYPEAQTFRAGCAQLAALHDELWTSTGIPPERTVLGGFSQGAVMSYALGLGGGRPRAGGILALSGFVPTVADWEPELATRRGLPVFIGHGTADSVISVEFARRARATLETGGLAVTYLETDGGHEVQRATAARGAEWLSATLRNTPRSADGV
jgi:phospholipase/carboxylesterase